MAVPPDTSSHVVTQYRQDGKSEFAPEIDASQPAMHVIEGAGAVQVLYQSRTFPAEVTDNCKDIADSVQIRKDGLLHTGRITIDKGYISEIVHIQPGGSSPMHRTRTLDLVVVVEGNVELELDNGEKRLFKPGDTITLRGATHKWTNVSAPGVWVKFFSATLDAAPMVVNDKVLEESWDL